MSVTRSRAEPSALPPSSVNAELISACVTASYVVRLEIDKVLKYSGGDMLEPTASLYRRA